MKSIIHVAQQAIARNRKNGTNEPPIIHRNYKGAVRAHGLSIVDGEGKEVARIINQPHKPLACGARVWIETELTVVPLDEEGNVIGTAVQTE